MQVPLPPNLQLFCFKLIYRQLHPVSAIDTLFSKKLPSNTFLSTVNQPFSLTLYLLTSLLLKVIFSVQNSNLMYFLEFSPDFVQTQVRDTVLEVFLAQMDIPIQVWRLVKLMRNVFNDRSLMQVPITENQLGTMRMVEEVSEHVEMNYPENLDFRYVAQPVKEFLFPWEESGSAENPIEIDEDEGFSETMTSQSTPQHNPPQRDPFPALRSIGNPQSFSAARQLLIEYFCK